MTPQTFPSQIRSPPVDGEGFKVGSWEVKIIKPLCGGVGVLLIGPRKLYYLPPIPADYKCPLPKYIREELKGIRNFVEVVFE